MIIITFTYQSACWNCDPHGQETNPRSQNPGTPARVLLAPPSRAGHRRTVSDSRVFRSPKPGSGQVRDATPGAKRRTSSEQSASHFGFSRPSFYQAQAAFEQGGLPALMPQKRGPKKAHKLTAEVLAFVRQAQQEDPSLRSVALASLVQDRYGITVHPRSIERAWTRSQKKLR
jgi:hypothetical protein